VLWQNGSVIDLGTPAGQNSEAVAINSYGHIVGFSYTGEIVTDPELGLESLVARGFLAIPRTPEAPRMKRGAVIVADPGAAGGAGAIIHVDPVSGAQASISSGGLFSRPYAVAVAANGTLYVADADANAVIQVDPLTGAQRLLASGGHLVSPIGIVIGGNGELFVVNFGLPEAFDGTVVRIDPVTGAQTLVAAGDNLRDPLGLALAPNGDLLIGESNAFGFAGGILRIDPATGAQTVMSSGGQFADPGALALDANGDLLVADHNNIFAGRIFRVSLTSGQQTLLASGGGLVDPLGVAFDVTGDSLLIAESCRFSACAAGPAVLRVNVLTGTQTVLASGGLLVQPTGVAVVDAARPDTAILQAPPALTKDRAATFAFTSEAPEDTFECRLDGASFQFCSTPVTHSGLVDGQHTFQVRAKNTAGYTDWTAANHSWRVDATSPNVPCDPADQRLARDGR
jgi:sugar lactone lactonase YvrE